MHLNSRPFLSKLFKVNLLSIIYKKIYLTPAVVADRLVNIIVYCWWRVHVNFDDDGLNKFGLKLMERAQIIISQQADNIRDFGL